MHGLLQEDKKHAVVSSFKKGCFLYIDIQLGGKASMTKSKIIWSNVIWYVSDSK